MFIYALNEEDRKTLISKGYEEVASCSINKQRAYAFEDKPSQFATFSKEEKKKFLVTDVAYFV